MPGAARRRRRSLSPLCAKARFNDRSHWGYGTGWGRGLLGLSGCRSAGPTIAHGAAIYGAAQLARLALEVAPPSIFWSKTEIAIDAFDHAVYAGEAGTTTAPESCARCRSR